MTRDEFLKTLKKSLRGIDKVEQEELLAEYEEHFAFALADGRDEAEVAAALGNPKLLAKEAKAQYSVNQAREKRSLKNLSRALLTVGSLGFLNLVFVLGPFLSALGVMIALYTVVATFVASPLLVIVDGILSGVFYWVRFLIAIGLCMVGLWLGKLLLDLTKWVYGSVLKYLQYNLTLVKRKVDLHE